MRSNGYVMMKRQGDGSRENLVGLLSASALFSGLNKKQLESIGGAGKQLSYDPGQTIVKEGETGVGFYLILEGGVEVRKRNKVLSKLRGGEFFGEMTLLDDQPRSADVVATELTKCYVLTTWSFMALVRSNPDIAINLTKELVRRLRGTNNALAE